MNELARASLIIGAMLVLPACGNLPLQYDLNFEMTPGYVSKEALKGIRDSGLTVAQVKQLLGEPNAALDAGSPAIGYVHCANWSGECMGVLVSIPTPKFPCSYTECQQVGIWFDAAGHAVDVKSNEGDERIRDYCSLEVWLADHGGNFKCYRTPSDAK